MLKMRVLGVAFLALMLAGVYLTYAAFTQKFTSFDTVTLEAPSIGLNMPLRADVKIRGVIVGQVLSFDPTKDGADLQLGIYPDKMDIIPKNVTGAILPKTLFGEKYVDLEIPQQASSQHLQAGQTITKSEVSTEVEAVLNDLYPLLRTVQPGQLNATLTAISTALDGRGEQLGQTLVNLDSFLKKFNPLLPQLVADLRQTAKVSSTYADVLPKIGQILRDTVTTTTTLRDRDAKVRALYTNVTQLSGTATTFLQQNGDNMIELARVSRPQLDLLARYSPEFPCLLGGIVNAGKINAEAFRNFTLHIVLEPLKNQPRQYTPADAPHYGDNRGPNCLHLPNPPWNQNNPVTTQPNFDDGVDSPTGKGTDRVAPGYWTRDTGFIGSKAESDLMKSLLAPGMGVPADKVSDLGPLLVGPMARGAKVSLR